jgi:hypothetical protein
MTQITLDLSPEIETQLREEAAKQGLDPEQYILATLHHRLAIPKKTSRHLSAAEAELLQHINLGLSADLWHEYHTLIDKRQAETLTLLEQQRLIELSDQLEALNVRRMQALVQLAALWQQPLDDVMGALGIESAAYG